jgi:hypothetical protein
MSQNERELRSANLNNDRKSLACSSPLSEVRGDFVGEESHGVSDKLRVETAADIGFDDDP